MYDSMTLRCITYSVHERAHTCYILHEQRINASVYFETNKQISIWSGKSDNKICPKQNPASHSSPSFHFIYV